MKKILFYICTFVFVSFTVDSKKLASVNGNYNTCLTETNVSEDDMLTMEDAEYNIEKMRTAFIKRTNVQSGDKRLERLENCINESKDLTEKCEKAFLLSACLLKSEHEHVHEYGYSESAK
ncbi:PREDICTED: pheromone-binding protein Gp-9-like [Atta colombica]|uniref:pheromone-binding protein Gp-9-like n=1 Tax=Atta colombica TaxID=520822 RepID=UPI00084CBDC2|nr:PREDICTED: pheromone-binding protein Gp-9-like [Atta colombica]